MTRDEVLEAIAAVAAAEYPHECCGLVAVGDDGFVHYPMRNVAPHPDTNFAVAPMALHATLVRMEAQAERFVALYHSHPSTEAYPSGNDVRFAAAWPGIEWVIVSLAHPRPLVRSFVITRTGEISEVEPLAG